MRIAQVSPLYESVPPKLYGGTERVVSFLTEELVGVGPRRHAVRQRRLAHPRASWSRARRRRCGCESGCVDPLAHHLRMIEQVYARAADFDVDPLPHRLPPFPDSRALRRRGTSTTLHGRLDLPELAAALPDVRRRAAGVDLRRAARAAAVRAAGRAPSITACRATSPLPRAAPGATWPFSAASRRRSASTARSRSRAALGMPLKIAAKIDGKRARLPRSEIKPAARRSAGRVRGRDRRGARRTSSWATRRRCCSRSTGRSRSAW